MRSTLARLLLILLVALTIYGLFHEQLAPGRLWTDAGLRRVVSYLAGFALVSGVIVWLRPGWLLRTGAVAAFAWACWWAGPLAPLAVLFFLGSCYSLGRLFFRGPDWMLALLAGAAVWIAVLWLALHFPVNRWWVYAAGFAIPYALARPRLSWPPLMATPPLLATPGLVAIRGEAAAFAVLLCVLGMHLFAALMPEVSADGLSMHLALPAKVAQQGYWNFDHRQEIWALMPAGADALYTGVYLLGGEFAAKLLNFAFLAAIAALLVQAGQRWTSRTHAILAAALFLSTPLAQLVTGSLFVENVWAALILGAAVALLREEFELAALLAGGAVAVKLIAAAFAAPILAIAFLTGGARRWRTALIAALLGLPVYVFAYWNAGNPVFPFANAVFRSPDYNSARNFTDARYDSLRPGLETPYVLTFESGKYIEGEGGAAGFQYLLLVLPAAVLVRKREQWLVLCTGAIGAILILTGAPNLRYLYAAMPLASLAIAWGPGKWILPAVIALNLSFLPAAGYYHRDFALWNKSAVDPYVASLAPARVLIEGLNRDAPGQPVAFFSTSGATAGLLGTPYTDTWHNEHYWKRVRESAEPEDIAGYLHELGIRWVVAPTNRTAEFDVVQRFLGRWLDPLPETAGSLTLYRLRDREIPVEKDTRPLGPGTYDDREPRVEYSRGWLHDNQFSEPALRTISYSENPGASARLTFEGASITYVFTRAANRGIAEIWLDGTMKRRIDLFSPRTQWQSSERVAVKAGVHALELRVSGEKNAQSAGAFVDLDAVTIE